MKNYKDYFKLFIGASDISCLTVRACGDVGTIEFGEDGAYYARLVDGDTEIPAHYARVFETGEPWLWIYDDNGRVASLTNKNGFAIYRAGDFGCIIQKIAIGYQARSRYNIMGAGARREGGGKVKGA